MVGGLEMAARYGDRLETSAVEYMVYSEKQIVGVICNHRPKRGMTICLTETG